MSVTRLKTIRFLALLVMIAGVLAIPVVIYLCIGSLISDQMHYTTFSGPHIRTHAARIAMYKMMGGLLLAQVAIGGGGFLRWKCKKQIAAQTPTT